MQRGFALAAATVTAVLAGGCGDGAPVGGTGNGGAIGTPEHCVVTVSLADPVAAIAGNINLDYSGTNVDAGFGPTGFTDRCRAIHPTMRAVAGNHCDGTCGAGEPYRYLVLTFQMTATGPESALEGPVDLFQCDFYGDGASLESLFLPWGDVTDPQGEQWEPRYEVDYQCGTHPTTTTTSIPTTTTTICDDPRCTLELLHLEVWLDDPVRLNSVDFAARFPCSLGEFVAARSEPIDAWNKGPVRCQLASDDVDLWATNEQRDWIPQEADPEDCMRILRLGAISIAGVHGPTPIATCEFVPGEGPVRASDFDVSALDWEVAEGEAEPGELSLSLRGFADPAP